MQGSMALRRAGGCRRISLLENQPRQSIDRRKRQALPFEPKAPALFELLVLVGFVLVRQVVYGQHSEAVAAPLFKKLLVKYFASDPARRPKPDRRRGFRPFG